MDIMGVHNLLNNVKLSTSS